MNLSRRAFLFLTGGTSAALAAEPSRQMVNRLIPYVTPPEQVQPGTWQQYASTCRECPAGCGVHLWHRDGRVTKAEGNPGHPVNRGTLCARGQSSMQGLYDPDRLRRPLARGSDGRLRDTSWDEALQQIASQLQTPNRKAAIFSDLQTGSLAEVMEGFAAHFGDKTFLRYEAFNYQDIRDANLHLFGRDVIPAFHLDRCDFVLSFACDFLESWLSPVEFASDFSRMHSLENRQIGRFVYLGPRLSMTAGSADDFIQVAPGAEQFVALAMLQTMLDHGWCNQTTPRLPDLVASLGGRQAQTRSGLSAAAITSLTKSFCEARASLALAGGYGYQVTPFARETALAVTLLNYAAGRIGQTIDFSRNHALQQTATQALVEHFLQELDSRHLLFIYGSNPAFTLPGHREQLEQAGTIVHMTSLPDETSELADFVLPLDAPAETWGDYSPWTGIEGLLQPAMRRLFDSRNGGDILIELAQRAGQPLARNGAAGPSANFKNWLEQRWRGLYEQVAEDRPFDIFWQEALRGGGIWQETDAEPLSLQAEIKQPLLEADPAVSAEKKITLWTYPSIFMFDGRTANRGWLQEAPDPMSTVVWGSWLDLHPQTAKNLGLRTGDVAAIKTASARIETTVRVTTDVGEGVAAIPLGQGHQARHLSLARGVGSNPFVLLDSGAGHHGVALERTGRREELVALSATRQQHDRRILRDMPLSRLQQGETAAEEELIMPLPEGYSKERDLYPPHEHNKHRWSMVVDLQRCIGCGACAVACYAENNIAVVGRKNAAQGLEMAWLKAVPYRTDDSDRAIAWLPLLCQHCDAAPCEPVCPVFAAVHNEEGLNAQVYNRCIGTRYCSNNCPYKVRRFNWINPAWKSPLELQLNPEVTVRCRGVMEKCTFCVQRIRQAEYRAMRENRPLRDGEILPACQQTCPSGVFTFGDLLDPQSGVSKLFRGDPRRYQLLRELNTKPAVVYLQKIHLEKLT